jgi:hypothetical protein
MSEVMATVITLKDAHQFYCREDEDHFFGWLQAIPAVVSVKGRLRLLEVSVAVPIDDQSLRAFLGLLARYGVDGTPLRPLCTPENEKWFKDPEKYWFDSVFGTEQQPTKPARRKRT